MGDTGDNGRSKNAIVVLVALLAALLAGGLVFVWQSAEVRGKQQSTQRVMASLTEAQGKLADLQTQVDELNAALEDSSSKPKPQKSQDGSNAQPADPLALDDGKYPVLIKSIDASGN